MKSCTKCGVDKGLDEYNKNKSKSDGLQSSCRICHSALISAWKKANNYNSNVHTKKCQAAEGHCVYVAVYPSGKYIGSGLTVHRRTDHLNGSSRISKSLNEKAISFEVLIISTKENCILMEDRLIHSIGLENLLNKQRAKSCK